MKMKVALEIQNITVQCGSFGLFSVIVRMCLTRLLQSNYLAGKDFIYLFDLFIYRFLCIKDVVGILVQVNNTLLSLPIILWCVCHWSST